MTHPTDLSTAARRIADRIAALEAENARLRERHLDAAINAGDAYVAAEKRAETAEAQLAEARRALEVMNAVVNHQTDRSAPLYHGFRLRRHPLTCGNDSNHTPLFPFWNGHRVVLICRDCDYTQDNAAMFDNAALAPAEKPGSDDGLDTDYDPSRDM